MSQLLPGDLGRSGSRNIIESDVETGVEVLLGETTVSNAAAILFAQGLLQVRNQPTVSVRHFL